jgi:hypothetical protein
MFDLTELIAAPGDATSRWIEPLRRVGLFVSDPCLPLILELAPRYWPALQRQRVMENA